MAVVDLWPVNGCQVDNGTHNPLHETQDKHFFKLKELLYLGTKVRE